LPCCANTIARPKRGARSNYPAGPSRATRMLISRWMGIRSGLMRSQRRLAVWRRSSAPMARLAIFCGSGKRGLKHTRWRFRRGATLSDYSTPGIPGPPPVDYLVGYRADGELRPLWHKQGYPYRALEPQDDFSRKHYPHGADGGWWSVLEMPRRASRLTLRIIEVRAQQLRDISEADCKAEGIFQTDTGLWSWEKPGVRTAQGAAWAGPDHAFANLYESINGQGSWEHNPWVWAISFEVIRDNVEKIIRAAAPP
jgi:hypothetical protein